MATNPDQLARDIQAALKQSGQKLTDRNKALAKAVVRQITAFAVVSLPAGSVTGTCPGGGPLTGGAGVGSVSGFSPDVLASDIAKSDGGAPTPPVTGLAKAVCNHLATAVVTFTPGSVTGPCSNSATSPGAFVGMASGGTFSGLNASVLAQLIAADHGGKPTDVVKAMAAAIVSHVEMNAEAYFLSGISGVAPAGGGPLTAGMGAGGKAK